MARSLIPLPIRGSPNDKPVPHSSQFYRDEWVAERRHPLRLDFNHSSNSSCVVVEAAPSVLLGRCDKSPLDGITVDISNHLGPGCLATDVRVKVTGLPELLAIASQFALGRLFECFEKL